MTAPLLSLIVPTRARAQTLRATLSTALAQRSRDFEIVVSDNASEDDTRAVVGRFGDERIRYFNTGRRLSMCGNYEFALGHARGDYVLIIGDDDAVIPGALDELLDELGQLAAPTIHMWPLHIYDWPIPERPARVAYLAPPQARSELSLKEKARSVVELGGWKYYELPSPYHSAVPRSILLAIGQRCGLVFNSTQPDVFTAMAIPAFADRAINRGRTVTMNGRSSLSNGLGFVKASARANIEKFIREYGDYRFHATLLQSAPAMTNMIPDAVLMARDLFPEVYRDTTFNYSAMWAYMCRIGFADYGEVLRDRQKIRTAHPFETAQFLKFAALHKAAVVRRHALDAWTARTKLPPVAPPDIAQFASSLAGGHSPALAAA